MMTESKWDSSFAIDLEGYDTDEVTSPAPRAARRAMPVARRNGTITSPAPAARPAGRGRAAGGAAAAATKRQATPALEPGAGGLQQQPWSEPRLTRAAAARGSTPAADAPAPAAERGTGRKRGRPASRGATPALPGSQDENQPSNLGPSGGRQQQRGPGASRLGSASLDGSPVAKRTRRASKSPAPPAAAAVAAAAPKQAAASKAAGGAQKKGARRGSQAPPSPTHGGSAPQQQQQQQLDEPGERTQAAGASKRRRMAQQGAPAPSQPGPSQPAQQQQQQQQALLPAAPPQLTGRPSTHSLLVSQGPQRSDTVRGSVLKSPTPPRRSISISTRGPKPLNLGGGVVGAALQPLHALLGGDQPPVDQPPQQPQAAAVLGGGPAGAEPAPADGGEQAEVVQPLAAPQPPAAEQQQQQQEPSPQPVGGLGQQAAAAAGGAAELVGEEGRGESPPVDRPAQPEAQPAAPAQASAGAIVAAEAAAGATSSPPAGEGPFSPLRESFAPCSIPREAVLAAQAAAEVAAAEAGGSAGAAAAVEPAGPAAHAQHEQQAQQVPAEVASPRRQSPRLKRPGSSGGSAEKAAGSVRFAALPPVQRSSPKQQQQRSPRSPNDSQQTAQRSTARQAGTPVSARARSGLEQAAGAEGDASWFDPLNPEKVSRVRSTLALSACQIGSVPLCREREVRQIDGFLQKHLAEGSGSSMYISGLPGTGKSLTVHELVRQCPRHAAAAAAPQQQLPPALISVNCMSLSDPAQVVGAILGCYQQACQRPYPGSGAEGGEEGAVEDPIVRPAPQQPVPPGDALKQLHKLVLSAPGPAPSARKGGGGAAAGAARGRRGGRKAGGGGAAGGGSGGGPRGMLVVVLDEMDGLIEGHSGARAKAGGGSKGGKAGKGASASPLLDLLALAHHKRSRLVLLGIANDLNLVHRLMPEVQAHPAAPAGLKPYHVPFEPYKSHQLARLLAQRVAGLPGPAFEPNALEMCARKVANSKGDMRMALTACCEALGVVVCAAKEAAEKAAEKADAARAAGEGAAGEGSAPAQLPPPRRVLLRHMAAALNKVTGGIGTSNEYVKTVRSLPPPQQLIMCVVAKALGDSLADKGTPLPRSALATPASTAKKAQNRAHFMSPAASGRSGSSSQATGGSSQGPAPGARSRELCIGPLFEAVCELSKKIGYRAAEVGQASAFVVWNPEDRVGFVSACENLACAGLLAIGKSANPGQRRVTMLCHEDDVVMGVADTPLIRNVVGA